MIIVYPIYQYKLIAAKEIARYKLTTLIKNNSDMEFNSKNI